MRKFFWYCQKIFNLFIVGLELLVYFLTHPKEISNLFFALYKVINEFYQISHGRLANFEETEIFRHIEKNSIYVKSNVFNTDSKVTRPMETQILSALVGYFQPATIFEIGTYNGFTTFHFALNSSPNCRIYTLDLPPNYDVGQLEGCSYDDLMVAKLSLKHVTDRIYHQFPERAKIQEIFGDSATFDFSPYHGKIDFMFIDGNHSYGFVKSDTENALKMLSDRGVLVWHDYDYIVHRDVFMYLNQLAQQYKIYAIPHTRFAVYCKGQT